MYSSLKIIHISTQKKKSLVNFIEFPHTHTHTHVIFKNNIPIPFPLHIQSSIYNQKNKIEKKNVTLNETLNCKHTPIGISYTKFKLQQSKCSTHIHTNIIEIGLTLYI